MDTEIQFMVMVIGLLEFSGKMIWNKPSGWTGPEAALYLSFDDSYGLVLWQGTVQMPEVPLVSGKVMVKEI